MTKTEQYILERLDNLERAFLQSQVNNVKVTENADQVPIIQEEIQNIKPYMDIKKAYIGDTSVVFENAPDGFINSYCESDDGKYIPTTTERSGNNVIIHFDALDEVAIVTISIM